MKANGQAVLPGLAAGTPRPRAPPPPVGAPAEMAIERRTVGKAVLYRADCRQILPRLAAESVDFVFTDPPYGRNNNNGDLIERREAALGRSTKNAAARPIAEDGAAEAGALARLLFAQAGRLLVPGGHCGICGGGGGPDPQFARWSLWLDAAVGFKQMVVWDKGPIGMGWHYRRSYEVVLVAEKPGGPSRWFDTTSRVENILRAGVVPKIIPSAEQHPTEKDPALAGFFMRLHARPGDLVLDPCMGAGSTGVAAARLDCRFVGVEIDPHWFEMACRNIEEAYRQAPLLVE